MPARRTKEDPANKTARVNLAALITNYEVTDPDILELHNRWQQKRRMDPKRLRLDELGAQVGMTQGQLYKKLQGQHPFTIGEIQALARFFGVTTDDITTEKKTKRGHGARPARVTTP